MDTLSLLPILGIVIYFYLIGFITKWCREKEIPAVKSFLIGLCFAAVFFSSSLMIISFFYQGKIMFFNDNKLLAVILVGVFSILGGGRCSGFIK